MYKYISAILILFIFTPAKGITVSASVDANKIIMGDVISFRIEAQGANSEIEVDIQPLFKTFSLVSGPATQSNFQWINGKMNRTRTVSWTLTPKKVGTIVIPSIKTKIGSKILYTKAITIEVSKTDRSLNNKILFIEAEIDKKEAFVGEQITITYKLYTQTNLAIEELEFPKHVGFWTEELFVPKTADYRKVKRNGVRYHVANLYQIAIFPTKTGELSLSPMRVKCLVSLQKQNKRRSIWDDPFFNNIDPFFNRSNRVRKILQTEDTIIHVKPYPKNQPSDFSGAVGEFSLKTYLDTARTTVNEAVTFSIEIRGTGNISLFSLPEIKFPSDFDVLNPSSDIKKEPFRDEITGIMTWNYILVPRHDGIYSLPRVEFPYFNPKDQKWHRAASIPLKLHVKPSETRPAASGYRKEEIVLLGKDIRYIRTKSPKWLSSSGNAIPFKAIIMYLLATGIYFLPGLIGKSKAARLATLDQRKSNRALSKTVKMLLKIQENQFESVPLLVYSFLKDKFLLNSDKLDPLTIQTLLQDRIRSEHMEELIRVLKICDAGRFAPGAAEAKDKLSEDAILILKQIDKDD